MTCVRQSLPCVFEACHLIPQTLETYKRFDPLLVQAWREMRALRTRALAAFSEAQDDGEFTTDQMQLHTEVGQQRSVGHSLVRCH